MRSTAQKRVTKLIVKSNEKGWHPQKIKPPNLPTAMLFISWEKKRKNSKKKKLKR